MSSPGETKPAQAADPAALSEYISQARVLIVDHSASSRPVLRRMLSELGVKTANVHVAESYEEAVRLLEANQPSVVFADYAIGSRTALELYREFARLAPDRLRSAFVVISGDNSPAAVTAIADADVDAVFVRPLNIKDLQEKTLETLALKAQPTPYLKMLEAGRRFFEGGKPEQALHAFGGAQRLDPKPAKACYLEGAAFKAMGDADAAFFSFKRGLEHDPRHYRCLVAVFELLIEQGRHAEAYGAGIAILDHYPLNPRRIPEMIRLCIVNQKFAEVLRFAETALELNLTDENLSKYVTAGLFICGKHLLKGGRKDEALQVLRRTESLSRARPKIVSEIIATLYAAGMAGEAEEMLKRAPAEAAQSHEVRLAILEQLHAKGIDQKAFLMSRELVHDGAATARLFEIALAQAKGLGRPDAVIQDLLDRATKAFPENREHYEQICGVAAAKPAA
jgi:CheY-like chemotaxis protein